MASPGKKNSKENRQKSNRPRQLGKKYTSIFIGKGEREKKEDGIILWYHLNKESLAVVSLYKKKKEDSKGEGETTREEWSISAACDISHSSCVRLDHLNQSIECLTLSSIIYIFIDIPPSFPFWYADKAEKDV